MKNLYTRFTLGLLLSLMLLTCLQAVAQTFTNVTVYDFTGCECPGTAAPSGTVSNLTFSNYSRGAGVSSNTGSNVFNNRGWNTTSEANAKAGNDYVEFTVTPGSGYQFTLTTLTFYQRRSNTGPPNYAVYASHDGYTTALSTGTVTTGGEDISVTLSPTVTAFTNRTTAVTFRVYAWGASTSLGTYRHDNVRLSGDRSLAASPNIQITQGATPYNNGSTYGFGSALNGSSLCQTFTITNTGTANLTIDSPTLSGTHAAEFSLSAFPAPLPYTILAGGSQTFDLCFNPSTTGSKTAKLSITTNVTGKNPYEINLTGTATASNGLFLVTPPGSTFYSSYTTDITWNSVGIPSGDALTVQYAEDGTNYNTIGTTTVGAGTFTWRPNFYQTTWNGSTFTYSGKVRIVSGAYSSTITSIRVSMQPCVSLTPGSTQTIALANFETTAPPNNWTYSESKSSDATSGPNSGLSYGTLSGSTPVNTTPGGSRGYVHTDGSATCESGTSSMSSTTVTFASQAIGSYINKYITLKISSLGLTGTNPCGASGIGVDTDDNLTVEVRLDGGTWQTVLFQKGYSNLIYSYASGTSRTINPTGMAYSTTTVSGGQTTGTLRVNIPDAATSVEVRVIMQNNRRHENWAIDDVTLVGDQVATESLILSRDCYVKPTNHVGLFPSSTYTGSLAATVANAANGDTDILIDGNLTVTGNFNLTGDAIVHLPVGTNLEVSGSMVASGGDAFVSSAQHLAEPGSGLVRNVTTSATTFPIGVYVDNNTSAAKYTATAILQAKTGGSGGKFVLRAMPTDDANNRPNAAYPYYNNAAARHASAIHTLWMIEPQTTTGNELVDITLEWDPAAAGSNFAASKAIIGHWKNSKWSENYESRTASTVTADSISSFSPFMVGNNNQEVFPVTLLGFWGAPTADGHAVDLYWRTAGEINCSHFELERSTDALVFAPITLLNGAGTTNLPQNYAYTDATLPTDAQTLYYRLRQVDYNGQYEYSNIIEVNLEATSQVPVFSLFPNPAKGPVTLTLSPAPVGNPTLEVFDVTGARLLLETGDMNTITSNLNDALATWAKGIYLLRLVADDQSYTYRLCKP